MTHALIGYTGFVGSTILKQTHFDDLYRSTNIQDIRGKTYDTVVCAGAPAVKWLANKEPENDKAILTGLMSHLGTITCKTFVLISTVDVFKSPIGVSERTPLDKVDLHPYGLHRAELEAFVQSQVQCERVLVVRLPGLVGPGLKKNIIFDFLNDNMLDNIDSRHVFQFYPMVNIWSEIDVALTQNVPLVHLTAEPVSVAEIARLGFGREFDNVVADEPLHYDLQSEYASLFGGTASYQYSKRETLLAVRAYAQSEPRKKMV